MAKFRTLFDLKVLLTDGTKGIKHANITGISAIPSIRIKGKEKVPTTIESGEIVLVKSQKGQSEYSGRYRRARYIIDGYTHFENSSNDDQTLSEMMADMERVFDLNHNDADAEYEYDIIDSLEVGPYVKGRHNWRIEAARPWEPTTGL